MDTAKHTPVMLTTPRFFSKRYWVVIVGFVLVAHVVPLNMAVVHLGVGDDAGYLPIQTRELEVVNVPPEAKRSIANSTPSQSQSRPQVVATPAVGITDPSPSVLSEAAPVVALEPPAQVSITPPHNAASQNAANDSVVTAPSVADSHTDAVSSSHAMTKETEKVTLTVPKQVKVPQNRNWSYTITHKTASRYAPDLPTDFRWQVDNGQYEAYLGAASLYAKLIKFSRQSQGSIGTSGLQPSAFTATQGNGTKTISYFNTAEQQVVFGAPGRAPKPLMPGAQDELSVAVQLASMFLGEPQRYRMGDQIVIYVVQRSDARVWVFQVEKEELVDIPAGLTPSIKLTRAPRSEYDTGVTVWLAPAHQYFPVRIRLDYSPDRYDDVKWKGF